MTNESGKPSLPPDPVVPRWRRPAWLLCAWIVVAWLSALVLLPLVHEWIDGLNGLIIGSSYGLSNDAADVVAAALDAAPRVKELLGPDFEKTLSTSCALTWTDQEKTYVHPNRTWQATPKTVWRAVTLPGRTVLGRYVAKLGADDCAEPSAFHEIPCTKVERLRLAERQDLAVQGPPGAGTEEPLPLAPGQCVLGAFAGKPGVVARYRVRLPADRDITVRALVIPASAFLSYRLSLHDEEAHLLAGGNTVFRSIGQGEYELEVILHPAVGAANLPGQYSLQAHWGRGVGPRCPIPGFDDHGCYAPGSPAEKPL